MASPRLEVASHRKEIAGSAAAARRGKMPMRQSRGVSRPLAGRASLGRSSSLQRVTHTEFRPHKRQARDHARPMHRPLGLPRASGDELSSSHGDEGVGCSVGPGRRRGGVLSSSHGDERVGCGLVCAPGVVLSSSRGEEGVSSAADRGLWRGVAFSSRHGDDGVAGGGVAVAPPTRTLACSGDTTRSCSATHKRSGWSGPPGESVHAGGVESHLDLAQPRGERLLARTHRLSGVSRQRGRVPQPAVGAERRGRGAFRGTATAQQALRRIAGRRGRASRAGARRGGSGGRAGPRSGGSRQAPTELRELGLAYAVGVNIVVLYSPLRHRDSRRSQRVRAGGVSIGFPRLAQPTAAQSLERARLEGIEDKGAVGIGCGKRRSPERDHGSREVGGHRVPSLGRGSCGRVCSERERRGPAVLTAFAIRTGTAPILKDAPVLATAARGMRGRGRGCGCGWGGAAGWGGGVGWIDGGRGGRLGGAGRLGVIVWGEHGCTFRGSRGCGRRGAKTVDERAQGWARTQNVARCGFRREPNREPAEPPADSPPASAVGGSGSTCGARGGGVRADSGGFSGDECSGAPGGGCGGSPPPAAAMGRDDASEQATDGGVGVRGGDETQWLEDSGDQHAADPSLYPGETDPSLYRGETRGGDRLTSSSAATPSAMPAGPLPPVFGPSSLPPPRRWTGRARLSLLSAAAPPCLITGTLAAADAAPQDWGEAGAG
eukprot:scaffold27973_cov107-Isochrysis_galbana.AAC.3